MLYYRRLTASCRQYGDFTIILGHYFDGRPAYTIPVTIAVLMPCSMSA